MAKKTQGTITEVLLPHDIKFSKEFTEILNMTKEELDEEKQRYLNSEGHPNFAKGTPVTSSLDHFPVIDTPLTDIQKQQLEISKYGYEGKGFNYNPEEPDYQPIVPLTTEISTSREGFEIIEHNFDFGKALEFINTDTEAKILALDPDYYNRLQAQQEYDSLPPDQKYAGIDIEGKPYKTNPEKSKTKDQLLYGYAENLDDIPVEQLVPSRQLNDPNFAMSVSEVVTRFIYIGDKEFPDEGFFAYRKQKLDQKRAEQEAKEQEARNLIEASLPDISVLDNSNSVVTNNSNDQTQAINLESNNQELIDETNQTEVNKESNNLTLDSENNELITTEYEPVEPIGSEGFINNLISKARSSRPMEELIANREKQKLSQNNLSRQAKLQNKQRKLIPYALLILNNNKVTVEQTLTSILEYCDRGVICYSRNLPGVSNDGDIDLVEAFVEDNPGFILVKYPLPVLPAGDKVVYQKIFNGNLHRYWLIDSIYNYALSHLIELAKANQEYDQALLLYLNPCMVYNAKALEYLHQKLEAEDSNADIYFFSSFKVASNYENYHRKGLAKLFSPFLTERRPKVTEPLFISYSENWNQFICRLNKIDKAIAKVFLPIRPLENSENAEVIQYDAKNKQALDTFNYWHTFQFQEGTKITGEHFLVSYEFFMESEFAYNNLDNLALTALLHPNSRITNQNGDNLSKGLTQSATYKYNGIPTEVLEVSDNVKVTAELDPNFFSKNYLLDLFNKFNYPDKRKPELTFGRTYINSEQLFQDENYRIDKYLAGFNIKIENNKPEHKDYQQVELERIVLNRFCNELTTDVQIFHIPISK